MVRIRLIVGVRVSEGKDRLISLSISARARSTPGLGLGLG